MQSLCVAYDASRIGVATTDGRMTLWEARAGCGRARRSKFGQGASHRCRRAHFAKLADFQAHDSYILKCCMSPDVKCVAHGVWGVKCGGCPGLTVASQDAGHRVVGHDGQAVEPRDSGAHQHAQGAPAMGLGLRVFS